MTHYYHLSPEERAMIMIEYNQGMSIRSIGRLLNRSASTIGRELKRNLVSKTSSYCASTAGRRYKESRKLCVKPLKLRPDTPLYDQVKRWLIHKQWSPEQISGTLKTRYAKQKNSKRQVNDLLFKSLN